MEGHSILCYNQSMSSILIVGKDLPDGLEMAETFASSGRSVFGVAKSEADVNSFESENIYASTWNKSSAVSAHSLIIKAETKLDKIEEVLFYFDTNYFCSKFEIDKTEEISNAVDVMMNSFFYSTSELLRRIDQKKEKIIVSFLVREYPSKYEMLTSKSPVSVPAAGIVSAAQQAFISIAETFAASVGEKDYLSVLLAKCQINNEYYKNEKQIADWLAQSMVSIRAMKNPQTVKQASTWNKVGSKVSTGFSFFK